MTVAENEKRGFQETIQKLDADLLESRKEIGKLERVSTGLEQGFTETVALNLQYEAELAKKSKVIEDLKKLLQDQKVSSKAEEKAADAGINEANAALGKDKAKA